MILVTGSTGFLGRHVFAALLRGSWPVRPLVRDRERYRALFPRGPGPIEADLTALKRGDLATERITGVVHLASEVWPVERADAAAFARVNVEGSRALLEALDARRLERLVLASSLSVLGALRGTLDESARPDPKNPYAASKLEQERVFGSFAERHGVPLAILRFPSIYGPGQPRGTVLPTFLEQALARRALRVENPKQRRQAFLFVEDAVAAVLAALGSDASGTYLVSPAETTSMAELATAVAGAVREARGHEVAIRLGEERDPPQVFAVDASKAEGELGWRPRYDLGAGLRATIAGGNAP